MLLHHNPTKRGPALKKLLLLLTLAAVISPAAFADEVVYYTNDLGG